MHDDDRVVNKPEGKKTDAGNIQDKLLLHLEGNILLGFRLKMLGFGELAARDDQQDDGYRAGDGKKSEAGGIDLIGRSVGLKEHDKIEEHRTDERTDLVKHLLQAEALADALLRGGKGHNCVLRGLFYRLAHALHDEQRARGDPAVLTHEREQRHRDNIKQVTRDGHGPITLCLIGQLAENIAHGIADKLAKAGDKADGRGGGAEQRKIRPAYAGRALMRHIREETDNAEEDYKQHCLRKLLFLVFHMPTLSCHVKSV